MLLSSWGSVDGRQWRQRGHWGKADSLEGFCRRRCCGCLLFVVNIKHSRCHSTTIDDWAQREIASWCDVTLDSLSCHGNRYWSAELCVCACPVSGVYVSVYMWLCRWMTVVGWVKVCLVQLEHRRTLSGTRVRALLESSCGVMRSTTT